VCEGHCSFTLARAATQIGLVSLEQVLTGTKMDAIKHEAKIVRKIDSSKRTEPCSENL